MWYLDRQGERLGPYHWEDLARFAAEGQLAPGDQVWHPGDQRWHDAGQLSGLIEAQEHSTSPPQKAAPGEPGTQEETTGYPRARKKRGCLLWMLGLGAVFAGGIALLFLFFGSQPSENIIFDQGITVARETVEASGGSVLVDQPGDPLHGFAIEVPGGAYEDRTSFTVSYNTIEEHKLGPYFEPVTPLINVDNGGEYSEEPMVVTIPVPHDPDFFTMAFYYNHDAGTLEGLPLMDAGEGYITVATRHFSSIVGSSISIDELQGKLDIDTGFRPGEDDWQFTNYGSLVAPRGHCAGQSISAMWYYYERRLKGERPLYGRYDNNDRGYDTIDFWQDDSWGYRLASAVQRDIDWDSYTFNLMDDYVGYNDTLTFMAFAYAMLLTEEPQFVGIRSSTRSGGHAIIAYRLEQDKIYVADPNYPGDEREILYSDGKFLPYNSGDNATEIAQGNEISYDRIGYFAKTSMVEWDQVGRRWAELDRGAVAEDLFRSFPLEVAIAGDNGLKWVALTDGFVTTAWDTAQVELPKDGGGSLEMTGKLAFRATPQYSNVYYYAYRKTDLIAVNTTDREPLFLLELEEGVNDFGFWVWEEHNNRVHYVDFQRYDIIYNQESDEDHPQPAQPLRWFKPGLYEGYYTYGYSLPPEMIARYGDRWEQEKENYAEFYEPNYLAWRITHDGETYYANGHEITISPDRTIVFHVPEGDGFRRYEATYESQFWSLRESFTGVWALYIVNEEGQTVRSGWRGPFQIRYIKED